MAYKKLIKVSNVCQLLDKRKFSETTTKAGVTFTNNGDGNIVVNGTCTADTSFYVGRNVVLKNGHQYLLFGAPIRGTWTTIIWTVDKLGSNDNLTGNRYTHKGDNTTSNCYIFVAKDFVADNLVFKPQFFDLTEMYGAGHEPTTVEQFRQDFPEEIYDYSPRCWLTSYKRVFMTGEGNYLPSYQRNLTCKTKNLLPNYASSKTVNGVTFIVNSDGTITANGTSTDKFLFEFFKPTTPYILDGRYTFSGCDSGSTSSYFLEFFGETTDGDITYRSCINIPIVINLINYKLISAYINVKSGATLENVIFKPMLNVGDTATDYVPYGHL